MGQRRCKDILGHRAGDPIFVANYSGKALSNCLNRVGGPINRDSFEGYVEQDFAKIKTLLRKPHPKCRIQISLNQNDSGASATGLNSSRHSIVIAGFIPLLFV